MANFERSVKEKPREPPLKKYVDRLFPSKTEEKLRAQSRVSMPVDTEVTPGKLRTAAQAVQHARWARALGYGMVPVIAVPTAIAVHALTVSPTFTTGLASAAGVAMTAMFHKLGSMAHKDVKRENKNVEAAIASEGLTYEKAEKQYPGFGTGEEAAKSHPEGHIGGLISAKVILDKNKVTGWRRLFHRTRFAVGGSAPERLPAKLPTLESLARDYKRETNSFIKNRINKIFSLQRELDDLTHGSEEYNTKARELNDLLKQHVS